MRGEGERRLGETPAAFGAHTAINLGVLELLDAAVAGELIDIGGDPQEHSPDATDVNNDVAALGVIRFGAHSDRDPGPPVAPAANRAASVDLDRIIT